MSRPVVRRRWWGARGLGAHRCDEGGSRAGESVHVSDVSSLAASRISVWSQGPSPVSERLASLAQLVEPAYDDYVDLVEGRLEAIVFPHPGAAYAWDHAPFVVMVAEAGGRFHDPVGSMRIDLGSGIFTNGRIDAELDALILPYLTM